MNSVYRIFQSLSIAIVLVLAPMLLVRAEIIQQPSDLAKVIDGEHRSQENKSRDMYRHPEQTLAFFELKPKATVIEIWPGRGWYTEVLAPYIKQGGGQFIAAGFPLKDGPAWRNRMAQSYIDFLAADSDKYNEVSVTELGPPANWSLGEDNSADTVLTFRNVHNWLKGGYETMMFDAFYQVLKPNGILGVVEHRAEPGTDLATMNQSGYVTEQHVIELAQAAGFELLARAEINANPKDTKQYPKGVWTLPPTLRLGDENKPEYLAIGESDRMTLKFIKK